MQRTIGECAVMLALYGIRVNEQWEERGDGTKHEVIDIWHGDERMTYFYDRDQAHAYLEGMIDMAQHMNELRKRWGA